MTQAWFLEDKHSRLAFAVLVSLAFWIYIPGCSEFLLFDDHHVLGPLISEGSLPSDWYAYLSSSSGPLGRPLSMASFVIEIFLFGNSPGSLKSTNVLIHLLNGCLVYLLSRALLELRGSTGNRFAKPAALLVASLWILHPSHVSTVLYTVQRMTQLSALFVIGGVLCYVLARQRPALNKQSTFLLAAPFCLFLPLAMLSKENGALLLPLLGSCELVLFAGVGPAEMRRYVGRLFLVTALLPALAASLYLLPGFIDHLEVAYGRREFTLPQRLLTEFRVMILYLGQILMPSVRNLGFFHDDIEVSKSLLDPLTTLASFVVLIVLALLAVGIRKTLPVVALGILWFLIGHSMESTILPLELMFEHRNYLPSYGVLLGLVAAATTIAPSKFRSLVLPGFIIFGALTTFVTASVVNDWRSEAQMYSSFYAAHPESPSAAASFAGLLANAGHYREAHKVLASLEGAGPLLQRWYLQCQETREISEPPFDKQILEKETRLSTYAVTGIIALTNLYLDDACQIPAGGMIEIVDRALELPTVLRLNRQKLQIYAAHLEWRNGRAGAAFSRLSGARALVPEDPMPWYLEAEWRYEIGDREAAIDAFEAGRRTANGTLRDYSTLTSSVEAMLKSDKPPSGSTGSGRTLEPM